MSSINERSNRAPVLGCIADDVTGATDLAVNLMQGGLRVVQLMGVPDAELLSQVNDVDAIVVALKTRSIPQRDAIDQSVTAMHALQKMGVTRFYFKYCSTFDSTDQGNIGPVAEALMDQLGVTQTIFCPAFPRAGRTVYQGHLFVDNQLLNESGMRHHPLNPMTDANLVRCLERQATRKVGLLSYNQLKTGRLADVYAQLAWAKISLVVTDACDDQHLLTIASSVTDMPLVTGGSGLARYLPAAYRNAGLLSSNEFSPATPQVTGRSLIVAGSCSNATLLQVAWMRNKCPTWQIDVAAVMNNEAAELEKLMTWAAENAQQPLLIAATSPPASVQRLQDQFGTHRVATAIENFLAKSTKQLVEVLEVRRLILAGGETSGAIVAALAVRLLHIGPEICAGVPWTETVMNNAPLALALKSGNFGAEDFFETALEMLP